MPKKIELFLHTKEHIQKDTEPTEHMKESHSRTIGGHEDKLLITAIHRWLPDDEIKAKELVEEFAKRQKLKLVIYDRIRFWDNLRAIFKGITTTPTVILGKHRFTANITLDRLQRVLGEGWES